MLWSSTERSTAKRSWNKKHDTILYYGKAENTFFNYKEVLDPLSEVTKSKYRLADENGRLYRLCGRGIKGSPIASQKDVSPEWEKTHPELTVRVYLNEREGMTSPDYWYIEIINQNSQERLGYPTQKPEALLERIIKASSNEGDLVLDPFCGCGTTVAVAQRLNRKWTGIDITYLAIDIIKKRLQKSKLKEGKDFIIEGSPADEYGAVKLAERYPFQFQYWAISKIPGGIPSERKTGDEGVDGIINFIDITKKGNFGRAIISVKGTKTANPSMVRDLEGTMKTKGADFGILITLVDPTPGMIKEAVSAGYFKLRNMDIPVIQIISVKDLFKDPLPLKLPVTHIIPAYKSMKMIKPEATELEFREEE